MEITSRDGHRALTYIAALNDKGLKPTVEQVHDFATTRLPRVPSLSDLARLGWGGGSLVPGWATYFENVGWVTVDADPENPDLDGDEYDRAPVQVTDLGRAVLKVLDEREALPVDLVSAALAGDDPRAYGYVIGQISRLEDVLLVDAYFVVDTLPIIIDQTDVRRVLTSEKSGGKKRVAALVATLQKLNLPRDFELRVTNEIHDRFVIPRKGPVEAVGTSLNSVGKNATIYTTLEEPTAGAVRSLHEDLWTSAKSEFKSP